MNKRKMSIYEILHSRSGRWWWDRRYVTEAEQEAINGPLDAHLAEEIDTTLDERARVKRAMRKIRRRLTK